MSEDNNSDKICCASCGTAEVNDVKLRACSDGCDLVRYCSDECQRDHKSQHEEDCKKRAAELREELLFQQPERSHYGDCPICCLPLPLESTKYKMNSCCSKIICDGCYLANWIREKEMRLQHTCPFCRKMLPETKEEGDKRRMKRIEMNDPAAMWNQGSEHLSKGEYQSAFDYFTKAAELGDANAHYNLALMYQKGLGVERNERKMSYHLEEAAMAGQPQARLALGNHDWDNYNDQRAVKHWIIAATQGDDRSILTLMALFKIKMGCLSKEDLAAALRAHHAAVDATKSPQRKKAEECFNVLHALHNLGYKF